MIFSIFLTTIGRPCLSYQLDSIKHQLLKEDFLYIAVDGKQYHNEFMKIWKSFENSFECKVIIILEEQNLGFWGHALRNKYQKLLQGDYILHADDDNFFYVDAFKYIRRHVTEHGKLYIFQIIQFHSGRILPKEHKVVIRDVDTSNGVCANIPERMGIWEPYCGGDGSFWESTSRSFGDNVVFVDEIIGMLVGGELPRFPEDLSRDRGGCAIDPSGCFTGSDHATLKEHCYDESMGKELVNFFSLQGKNIKIVDFGCGKGDYVKLLRQQGFAADGFDGNPETPKLTDGVCGVLNLAEKEPDLSDLYDWVCCFEVGEHVPKWYESRIIDNLCKYSKTGIALSWALPGQLGHGHVNCHTNEYVISQLEKRGYQYELEPSTRLRTAASLPWFKNTIMVFTRKNDRKVEEVFENESTTDWCRVVMNRSTKKLLKTFVSPGSTCFEISGNYWEKSGLFSSYQNAYYPQFDICTSRTNKTYDVIVAEQVLEHVKFPYRALTNIYNMLNPGGLVLITTPFLIQLHDFPGDYTRWTPAGLKYLFVECGFDENNIIVDSWGNRECIKDSFYTPWSRFQPGFHSLENEPIFPIVVWGLAKKS